MKIQDVGCAPCWKTATITPEGSTQKSAFPLKKLGLVQSRVPVLLKENVVVMSPGVVLGAKYSYVSPVFAENCATVPFENVTQSWLLAKVSMLACVHEEVALPV